MTKPLRDVPRVRVLTLEGITLKGKNRVREHGFFWRVLRVGDSHSLGGFNHWLLIEPLGDKPRDTRWIDPRGDLNFVIKEDRELTDIEVLRLLGK
jgi:hypothetical protein